MQPGIFQFDGAAFGYDGRNLLTDLSLEVGAGSFHFVTGPSGAGKTTFLRMCYLELRPTTGRMALFGRDSARMTRDDIALSRRRVGVVHQDCRFLDHLDVRQNIALPLMVAGHDVGTEAANIDELLQWVGLEHRQSALPPELSGGERQRAALARAVVMAPDLILADEPTGNVDREMSERLLGLLLELNRSGRTIVVATHDLSLIRSAKSHTNARVLRLKGGRIEQAEANL